MARKRRIGHTAAGACCVSGERFDMDQVYEFAARWYGMFFGPASRLSPIYIAVMVIIAFAVWRWRRIDGSFVAWFMPASIWRHSSTLTDLKLFIFGRLVGAMGIFGAVSASVFMAKATLILMGAQLGVSETTWHPVWITLALLVVNDFGVYWAHRLHHQWAALWPFHEVHHSAEVLTPLTVYRKHPIYDVFAKILQSALIGVLQGVWLYIFVGKVSVMHIAGANVFYILFNIAGSNFRHSHVWIGYGRWLSHVLISPAQHQIHHSIALKHRDKNFGEVLAIWDWMFGTLYVPKREEALTFGLSDEQGRPIEQPHTGLLTSLWRPIADSWRVVSGPRGRAAEEPAPHPAPVER